MEDHKTRSSEVLPLAVDRLAIVVHIGLLSVQQAQIVPAAW